MKSSGNDDFRRTLRMLEYSLLKDFFQSKNESLSFSLNDDELGKFCKVFSTFMKARTWIFLEGELGSGKTTFTKGLGYVFHCHDLSSPTFSILNKHKLKKNSLGIDYIFHLDLYRMNTADEVFYLGLEDELSSCENSLVIIEWPKRINSNSWKDFFEKTQCPRPKLFLEIQISYTNEFQSRDYLLRKNNDIFKLK